MEEELRKEIEELKEKNLLLTIENITLKQELATLYGNENPVVKAFRSSENLDKLIEMIRKA